jgi:hypothetical protein
MMKRNKYKYYNNKTKKEYNFYMNLNLSLLNALLFVINKNFFFILLFRFS